MLFFSLSSDDARAGFLIGLAGLVPVVLQELVLEPLLSVGFTAHDDLRRNATARAALPNRKAVELSVIQGLQADGVVQVQVAALPTSEGIGQRGRVRIPGERDEGTLLDSGGDLASEQDKREEQCYFKRTKSSHVVDSESVENLLYQRFHP